jgi:hypothetical protein
VVSRCDMTGSRFRPMMVSITGSRPPEAAAVVTGHASAGIVHRIRQ